MSLDMQRMQAAHALPAEECFALLSSQSIGLDERVAARRLEQVGLNRWVVPRKTSAFSIFIRQLTSVVVLLLIVAAAVAFAAGDRIEATAIVGVLVLNTALGFVIELRARRSMEALLKHETAHAVVIRDSHRETIAAENVVPGDVIELEAGMNVPADARLFTRHELRSNEASLTGESMPVDKVAAVLPTDTALADRTNMLFAGTAVVAGSGQALVVATGPRTEIGRIGGLVAGIPETRTPLERRIAALGTRLALLTIALCGGIVVIGALTGRELVQLIETAIALAVAAVPEGLPAVATIAMAVGLSRMARRNALIRNLHSVEALGSTTVVCVDKTGTLTAGEMTAVKVVFADGTLIDVEGIGYQGIGGFTQNGNQIDRSDPRLQRVAQLALLGNHATIAETDEGFIAAGDPTDAALRILGIKAGADPAGLSEQYPTSEEIPFTAARGYIASVHQADGKELLVVRGAPERVEALAETVLGPNGPIPITEELRARIRTANHEFADRALRVIALAYRDLTQASGRDVGHLTFVALVGIADPPAANVAETVSILSKAGIRTLMITGDQKKTAAAVARQIGLSGGPAEIHDAHDIAAMSEQQFRQQVSSATAFARITPDDKLRIVSVLQENGEIVAMIGDGVNDSAALRKADVGVAMGRRGSDVAKENAGVILQDDRFSTIAAAVEEGRIIDDNIRKFVFYLFSCNLAEILVIVGATLSALALPLLPLQILWLNLVTDTFPALALALEPGDPLIMTRPPRAPKAPIISRRFFLTTVAFAVLISIVTLAGYGWGVITYGLSDGTAVTMAFSTLAFAQLFHLGSARSKRVVIRPAQMFSNRYAIGAVVLVTLLQIAAVHTGALQRLLGTTALSLREWLIVAVLAAVPGVLGQLRRVEHG